MKKTFVILSVIFLLPFYTVAQKWKNQQILFGAGVTNFFGDLGGGNSTGRPGPADLNMAATRPALFFGYRYEFNNVFKLRSNLTWGILSGDDKYTDEPYRNGRNLNFRSGIVELNLLGEFYLVKNKRSNLYRLRGVNNRGFYGIEAYLFGGIGVMYFNPKAKYDGKWVALQPIGTEGQGLEGEDDKYNRVTVTMPYGIGFQKVLSRFFTVGIEASMRMTFTDYIDDVSGTYYGRDNLMNAKLAAGASMAEAERAAHLSDPNIFHKIPEIGTSRNNQLVGEKRGDPSNNDSFVTVMFTLSKKIQTKRRSRAKF